MQKVYANYMYGALVLAEFTKMTKTQSSIGKHPLLTLTNNFFCPITGLLICLISGRYSAPFPMQNSIFFPNLVPKFSQFDSLGKKNWKSGEKKTINWKIIIYCELISKSTLIVCKIHDVQLKETSIWITKYVLVFPNFKENTAIFSQFQGPRAPVPKRGMRALYYVLVVFQSPSVIFLQRRMHL